MTEVALVPVHVLAEMLLESNKDLSARLVHTEIAAALNRAGYPFTTKHVALDEALAMLEALDEGGVETTPGQRAALCDDYPPHR